MVPPNLNTEVVSSDNIMSNTTHVTEDLKNNNNTSNNRLASNVAEDAAKLSLDEKENKKVEEMNNLNKLQTDKIKDSTQCTDSKDIQHNNKVNKRIATHRRNMSLDFRAMGIVLPQLPNMPPPPSTRQISPPSTLSRRILPKIPEHIPLPPSNTDSNTQQLTPKLKHVMKKILTRKLN